MSARAILRASDTNAATLKTMASKRDSRCLFCLRSEGGFTAQEHPISESIGNTSVVLPVGVVCDTCNHGVLSVLDQSLAEFLPVKLRRTTLGVRTKDGKVPLTTFQEGRLLHNGRFAALHGDLSRKSWTEEFRSRRDPRFTVGMATLTGGRPLRGRHVAQVSRALLKVAFGCAWLEQHELLLSREFNVVRAVILGTQRPSGYFFMSNEIDERNTRLSVSYEAIRDGEGNVSLRVHANFYGVVMVTDSRPAPPPPGLADLGTVVPLADSIDTI